MLVITAVTVAVITVTTVVTIVITTAFVTTAVVTHMVDPGLHDLAGLREGYFNVELLLADGTHVAIGGQLDVGLVLPVRGVVGECLIGGQSNIHNVD